MIVSIFRRNAFKLAPFSFRTAPLISRRGFKTKGMGYEHLMSLHDTDASGTVYYGEFLAMAETFKLGEKHVNQVAEAFFPTKEEKLGPEEFALLFQRVFDFNWDGLLQYGEFNEIVKYLPITDNQEAEAIATFFPNWTDELDADKYDELMMFLNNCLKDNELAEEA